MTQTKTTEHAETSLRLLDEAEKYLENDDLYKACEKGLEAVHSYLRMVGEQGGWVAETQRDLNAISSDLAFETDDRKEASSLYRAIEGGLAIKFWGSHHTWWQVEGGIRNAREWISLMENRSKPPPEVRDSQLNLSARQRAELMKGLKKRLRERRARRLNRFNDSV